MAALLLGWVVDRATIDGPENCIDPLLVAIGKAQRDHRRAFGLLKDLSPYMTIVFAGPAAEARSEGGSPESPVAGVLAAAKADFGGLLSDQELEHLVGGSAALAERIVSHERTAPALAELSTALVGRRSMTANDIDTVVRPVLPEYPELFDGEAWTITVRGR